VSSSAAPSAPGLTERAVTASWHAQLALLERVDAQEQYPGGRLRRLWRRSEPSDHPRARRVTVDGEPFRLIYDRHPRGGELTVVTIYPVNRGGRR
jgi:hypothetical protein